MILEIRNHTFNMEFVKFFYKEDHPDFGYRYVVEFKDGKTFCVSVKAITDHTIKKVN